MSPPSTLRPGLLRPGAVDVPAFLDALGVKNVSANGEEISFSCPFPGHTHGDNRPSARMNAKTTAWFCHGCKRHGNAITFTAWLQGVTNDVAWGWITRAYGADDVPSPEDFVLELDTIFGDEVEEPVTEEIIPISPSSFVPVREWPEDAISYMTGRGFLMATLEQYGLRFDPRHRRIVTPLNDRSGKLVGWKGRAIGSNERPKYLVYEPVYQATNYIYLLDTFVPDDGMIVVCEGEWNALKMRQLGWRNVVGLPGSYVSKTQAGLIASSGAHAAVLIFDSDKAGFRGVMEAVEILDPWMDARVAPDHERDPAQMNIVEIATLISESKTMLEWELT